MSKKTLQGIVKSTKMAKTLVVAVNRVKKHPKYKKHFNVTKRYKAHYEDGKYNLGDRVLIEESSPISKDKKWKVRGLVKKIEPKSDQTNVESSEQEVVEEKVTKENN